MSVARRRTLDLQHAETLLDVVFGVVIALPLIKLPTLALTLFGQFTTAALTVLLLLASSLGFCAFYWLEVRLFIDEQGRFDRAIEEVHPRTEGAPLPLTGVVLGILIMMAFATATLNYSEFGQVRAFLVANVLFWVADFIGALTLQRLYSPLQAVIDEIRSKRWEEHGWFWGHLQSPFFIFYALLNALFFGILLVGDVITNSADGYELVVGILVLAGTLIRHGYVRTVYYAQWVGERHHPLAV